jgi:hypothetical protein
LKITPRTAISFYAEILQNRLMLTPGRVKNHEAQLLTALHDDGKAMRERQSAKT